MLIAYFNAGISIHPHLLARPVVDPNSFPIFAIFSPIYIGEKIAKIGNEFGSTTGRARRCGWIDIPALKYAININGVTQLMMMKTDVLSGFETIKVCTHYELNGKKIDYLPFDDNEQLIPIYQELPGWQENLMELEKLSDAPMAVHKYISWLEDTLKIPISIVSVGPDRKQTLFR